MRLRGGHRGPVSACVLLHRDAHTRSRFPRKAAPSSDPLGLRCSDFESNSMTMTRRALVDLFSYARRYLFMQDKPQVIGFLW